MLGNAFHSKFSFFSYCTLDLQLKTEEEAEAEEQQQEQAPPATVKEEDAVQTQGTQKYYRKAILRLTDIF